MRARDFGWIAKDPFYISLYENDVNYFRLRYINELSMKPIERRITSLKKLEMKQYYGIFIFWGLFVTLAALMLMMEIKFAKK